MTTLTLFPSQAVESTSQFPQTRYQGSKAKMIDWIWYQIKDLDFHTCLDAFGGTGTVAYRFKKEGKSVIYNDFLKFNYLFGLALIENSQHKLSDSEVDWLLSEQADTNYPNFIQKTFENIYFTTEENKWLDRTLANMRCLDNQYKFAIAFFALAQACIIKRPYNLFHRKNLYVRTAEVKRSFGNKVTWDRSFSDYFRKFTEEANGAVFDNGNKNTALNLDVFKTSEDIDLVYIDSPYISSSGIGLEYRDFYHFLEGLTQYDIWHKEVDFNSKHRRLIPKKNIWNDKRLITEGFDDLFKKFKNSMIVVSYRSDGIPTESELVGLLRKYKSKVVVRHYGEYKYALSKNNNSKEILFIAT